MKTNAIEESQGTTETRKKLSDKGSLMSHGRLGNARGDTEGEPETPRNNVLITRKVT